jgi:hypothetical protein
MYRDDKRKEKKNRSEWHDVTLLRGGKRRRRKIKITYSFTLLSNFTVSARREVMAEFILSATVESFGAEGK